MVHTPLVNEQHPDVSRDPNNTCRNSDLTKYTYYPLYCFRDSPTYFSWAKLTAAEIHALKRYPGFKYPGVYAYKNHPIRYVKLVGPIVAVQSFDASKIHIVTLDDGSGSTINIRIICSIRPDTLSFSNSSTEYIPGVAHVYLNPSSQVLTRINVGMIMKVRGIISEFRNSKQLNLRHAEVWSRNTNREVHAWKKTLAWRKENLSQAWVLDIKRVRELHAASRAKRYRDLKHCGVQPSSCSS